MKIESMVSKQTADFYTTRGKVDLDYVNGKIEVVIMDEKGREEKLAAPMILRMRLDCGENIFYAKQDELYITVTDMTNVPCSISAAAPTFVTIIQGKECHRRHFHAHLLEG